MLSKVVYLFDEAGYFYGTDVMFENAMEPGTFFERADSTDIEPKGDTNTHWFKFGGGKWTAIKKPTCAAEFVGMVISHESMTAHDIEARELIKKFSQEEGYREKRGEDLSWAVEKIPEKTAEEKRIEAEQMARAKRDALISQTDYLLTPDYPIGQEDLAIVKEYRTQLRNVPQQEGFPEHIEWPELPAILKK